MGRPQTLSPHVRGASKPAVLVGPQLAAETAADPGRAPLRKAFDMVCAALLLLAAAPVMALAALAVRLSSHGPILHREPVLGERGRVVTALSFRVTVDGGSTAAHENLRAVIGAAGRQPFAGPGRFLCATRGDRLPRLLNVAAGQLPLF